MLSVTRLQAARGLARQLRASQRVFSVSARQWEEAASPTKTTKTTASTSQPAVVEVEEHADVPQAPNRSEVWAKGQQPRSQAMTGPRFEQTDFDLQPAPYSAMELVHKQPVSWTSDRAAVCDGGGGPHGHPRIFINTDKPEIAACGYCGKPFANEHHREHLESLTETAYPLTHGSSM
ncbi:hypothetical protein MKZ38_002655 [Zalerion maritima]|uniref:Zinc finger CHCC-type domain-containing protein n=1 Tax=Zalerion maritima TaxID=339359 RepID=A0AAD5RXD9_9PEZI|nr:hypothetical protein MKZ38_002655 [Zalerion maritima]